MMEPIASSEKTSENATSLVVGEDVMSEPETDYMRFRGKCRELSEAAVAADPALTLVRGYYLCPWWGEQAHWWTVRQDGTIHDPTAAQFPSKGAGVYVPFDGMVTCEECGKELKEEEATIDPPHVFCSTLCYARCVGVA